MRPGSEPMYVRRWPRISASSRTPPSETRTNLRPSARAIDLPSDVLPTPGGPTKHRIGPLMLARELEHREVLEDALLDLLAGRSGPRRGLRDTAGDVVVILGRLVPRQADQPVEVVAHHGRLGRHGRHLAQPVELLHGALLRVLRHARRADLLRQLLDLARELVLVAQLLADRLELLVEIELLLVLVHLLRTWPSILRSSLTISSSEASVGRAGAQRSAAVTVSRIFCLACDLDEELRRHRVREAAGSVMLLAVDQHFVRDAAVEVHVLVERGEHVAHQRLDLGRRGLGLGDRAAPTGEIRRRRPSGNAGRGARTMPSTSTRSVPSGSRNSCSTRTTVPTA